MKYPLTSPGYCPIVGVERVKVETMKFTDTFCPECGKPTPLAIGNCLICGAMLSESVKVLVIMPTPAQMTVPSALAA
jgi:ribosomal protein S27AE